MNPFDMNEYLNRRLGNNDKAVSLHAATTEKTQDLEETAWTKKLGLDPTGFMGSVVNLGASLASGATRLGGQITSLPTSILSAQSEMGLPDEAIAPYNRHKQGVATPEDLTLLNQRGLSGLGGDGPTLLEQFQQGEKFRQISRKVSNDFDTSSIVDQTKRNQLTMDLGDDFQKSWDQVKTGYDGFKQGHLINGTADAVSGVAKLLFNAGEAAVTNPGAASEYIVENIPQLAVGAFGKVGMLAMDASNIGYGADLYQQGVENYQKAHNGELPPVDERQRMAMHAAGAIVAESAGDHLGLAFTKAKTMLPGAAVAEDQAIRTGFKQAIKNSGTAGFEGLGSEGLTESYQTYAEGEATGKPASAQDIYVGGVIGGIAGAGLSGGGRVIAEGVGATPQHAEKRAQDLQKVVEHVKALETNDPSAYLDTKSKTYDPSKAMDVLLGNAKLESSTPETKQANQDKANALITGLEEQRIALVQATPTGIEQLRSNITQLQERIATAETPAAKERLQLGLEGNQEALAEMEAIPAATLKQNAQALDKLDRQIASVRNQKQQLDDLIKPVDLEATVALVNSVPDTKDTVAVEQHKIAVDKLINLSMNAPEHISDEMAQSLADHTGIAPAQRQHFKMFSEARIAENAAKDMRLVASEIMLGDSKTNQLGLANYRHRVTEAINAGNKKVAQHSLSMLASFAKGHIAKAKVFTDALNTVNAGPKGTEIQLIPTKGVWSQATQNYSAKALLKLGGKTIHRNSGELVTTITTEAKALQLGYSALKSSVALKFTPTGSSVNSVSQGNSVTSVNSSGNQSQLQSNEGVDNTVNTVVPSTKVSDAPTKTVVPTKQAHAVKPDPVPSKPVVQASPVPVQESSKVTQDASAVTPAKPKKPNPLRDVQPENDSLLRAIARLGGIATQALTQNAVDLKDLSKLHAARVIKRGKNEGKLTKPALRARMMGFNQPVYRHSGLTLDSIREALPGYFPENAAERDVLDAILGELNGKPVFSLAEDPIAAMEAQQAAYDAEMLAEQEANAVSGYNDLETEAQQQFADDTAEAAYLDKTEDEIRAELQDALDDYNQYYPDDPFDYEAEEASQSGGVTESTGTAEASTEASTTEESPVVPGELDTLQGFLPYLEGKPLHEVFQAEGFNPAAQFLKQAKIIERTEGTRPLVGIKNFLTTWAKKFDLIKQYLPTDRVTALKPEEESALRDLMARMKEWAPLLQKNFLAFKGNKDFKTADMMQYFLTDTHGVLDAEENIKSAMAYGMYSWLVRKASSPTTLLNKQINKMHNRNEGEPIHPGRDGATNRLYTLQSFEHTTANELGEIAIDALGLKLRENSPPDVLARLKTAMGLHMVAALVEAKYVTREVLSNEEVSSLFDNGVTKLEKVPASEIIEDEDLATSEDSEYSAETKERASQAESEYTYVSLVLDEKSNLGERHKRIQLANAGTSGIVDQLFGNESVSTMAPTKPMKFTQKFAKKTGQAITELQRQAIQKSMDTPHKAIPIMLHLKDRLGRANILKIAGWIDLEANKTHAMNIPGVASQNRNLESQFDLAEELVETNDDETEFFPEHSVWKNYRGGIETPSLNMQSSKIHRAWFSKPSWTVKYDPSQANYAELIAELKISVMMNTGLVKTDKQNNVLSLAKFDAALQANPKMLKAIAILQKEVMSEGDTEMSAEDQATIIDVASAEGMLALQAMTAYAQYLNSLVGGKPTAFEATMIVGADGKTNGPMLTLLALGAEMSVEALFGTINRGGMYSTDANQAEHFSQWSEDTANQDLYENTTDHLMTALAKNTRSAGAIRAAWAKAKTKEARAAAHALFTPQHLDAIQAVTGAFKNTKITSAGRNLVKTPITAFFFGSSITRAIKSMEDVFMDNINTAFQDIATGARTNIALPDFIAQLNVLIYKGNYKLGEHVMDVTQPVESLLEKPLHWEIDAALRKAFSSTMSGPVRATFDAKYQTLISRRKALNNVHAANYEAYRLVREQMREQEMERLMDTGEIAYREKTTELGVATKEPLHDMTPEQEATFEKLVEELQPVVHTAMSLDEKNIKAGMMITKSKNVASTNRLYKNQVNIKTPVQHLGKPVTWRRTSSMKRELDAPGVAGAALQTHSLDASIMHNTVLAVDDVLNVHDEGSSGVSGIRNVAGSLNQNTIEYLLKYSPAREALHTFERIVQGLAAKQLRNGITPDKVKGIFGYWADLLNVGISDPDMMIPDHLGGEQMLEQALNNAYQADTLRLGAIAKMGSIDQYTWEGGHFLVTPEIRADAAAQLTKLSRKASTETRKAMKTLAKAIAQAQPAKGTTAEAAVQPLSTREQVVKDLTDQGKRNVIWLNDHTGMGKLGTANVDNQHKGMVAFFTQNNTPTAKELLDHLTVFGHGLTKPEIEIAKQIQRVVDPAMVMKYLTKTTEAKDILNGPASTAQAWYIGSPTESGKYIHEAYILGTDFAKATVTPKVVLHELLHAALSQAIAAAESEGTNVSPEAKTLVDNLNALLTSAREQSKVLARENPTQGGKIHGYGATALSNLQEFVAYGMTDPLFRKLVLDKVVVSATEMEGTFISGLQSFIKTVVGFIIGKGKHKLSGTNAMERNIAGLFEVVATEGTPDGHYVSLNHTDSSSYTTQAIYDTLDGKGLSPVFDGKLNLLLGTLVHSLHGQYGSLGEARMEAQSMTAREIWEKAEQDGVVPFASQSLAAGFKISEKEAFVLEQVEVTIKSALDSNTGTTTVAYTELAKLYREVSRKVSPQSFHPGDWATATIDEQREATALHDFIFKIEKTLGNRSDYLARFAALGLAHEGFNNILKMATDRVAQPAHDEAIIPRLERWFQKLLEFFAGKLTHTYAGQHADSKLDTLIKQLVGIEAKRVNARPGLGFGFLVPVEGAIQSVSDTVRSGVEKVGRSNFVRNKLPTSVAAVGALASTVAGNRVDILMDHYTVLRDRHFKQSHDFVAGVIDEVRGTTEHNATTHEAMRIAKYREGERKTVAVHTSNTLLTGFLEDGKQLKPEHREAITVALVRTDVASLLKGYTMAEIEAMIRNPKVLERNITKLEKSLSTFGKYQPFYSKSAKLLGYRMATGKVRGAHVLLNAHNISKLYGTRYSGKINQTDQVAAEAIIDPLVTMYALRYTAPAHLAAARQVLDMELPRGDDNGVALVLKFHRSLQDDSRQRLFVNGEALMMKGYTPEIFDPKIDLVVANTFDGAKLEKMGYRKGGIVGTDSTDPDKATRNVYTVYGGGSLAYQSGAFSTTGERHKGNRSATNSVKDMAEWVANRQDIQTMRVNKQTPINDMFTVDPGFDPANVEDNFAAPILNSKGDVVDYRYFMSEHNKDTLLNRNSNFEKVLGTLAGNIYDKETTKTHNRSLVTMLKEQYDTKKSDTKDSYINIGPESDNAEFRQIYKMLPKDTQDAIRDVWGKDGMWVRIDLLNTLFGYRQLSLSGLFDENRVAKGYAERIFVELMTSIMGEKAGLRVRRAEDVWQEIVHATKDNMVIRSLSTLKGNMISNVSVLLIHGISPVEILRQHRIALKGATQYRKDTAELTTLQIKLASGFATADTRKMEHRVLELEDSIARNPVVELIEAGLMPTIVEDVSPEDDMYSYKSLFAKKLEKYSNKVNKHVLGVGKVALMAHDTSLYQMMSHAAQISDFLARYTLYQNKINKAKNPMAKKEAIQLASDTFINYDIPSHRTLQYMNDMGMVWFTKYYLRIQKVISNLYQKEPGRVMAMLALEKYVMNTSTILDSSIVHRLYNPLSDGALKYPGSLSEIVTAKLGAGLFSLTGE